jgi:hypothetical protein
MGLGSGCTRDRDVTLAPGVAVPEAPQQTDSTAVSREIEGFRLDSRALFRMRGKLLSKRRYRWDELAPIVPWDFALAWGVMSDERVLDGIRLVQGDRRMFWHLYDLPVPLPLVEQNSANVHLIPATADVARRLDAAPTGAVLLLEGELVDVTLPDGRRIPTSTTRYDRGAGACEILFLTGVEIASRETRDAQGASTPVD